MVVSNQNRKMSSVSNGTEMNNVTKEKGLSAITMVAGHPANDRHESGLKLWQTTLFIVGEVAGSGVLALPYAILGTGWIGIVLLAFFCFMAGYSGLLLGKCWIIVEERFPKYSEHVRNPYQTIAQESYGTAMKYFANFSILVTQFGGCTVISILMAGMLRELFASAWDVSICYWTLIVVAFLIPLSWLGTPKDFWGLAIGATSTVILAGILLLIQTFIDYNLYEKASYPTPQLKGFSLAFGTILFAFGGSAAFPTIQNDMRNRKKFPLAAVLGFSSIFLIYAPVTIAAYVIFGSNLLPNLALTVSDGPLKIASQILLILHLLCASMIVINPIFQELEGRLNIGEKFSLKRCSFRTCIMLMVLFVGESVPSFGKILALVGGSTNTLLVFIFPALFYMKLASLKNPAWKEWRIPLYEKVFMWEIILVGFVGGVASTISAIWDIATPDALSLPCYLS